MNKRLLLSILLVVLGIAIAFYVRGPIGRTLGPFLIVGALLVWAVPKNPFLEDSKKKDQKVNPISLVVLGSGLGLLAAAAAAFLLPPQIFSWLLIAAGIALIIWLLIRRRR